MKRKMSHQMTRKTKTLSFVHSHSKQNCKTLVSRSRLDPFFSKCDTYISCLVNAKTAAYQGEYKQHPATYTAKRLSKSYLLFQQTFCVKCLVWMVEIHEKQLHFATYFLAPEVCLSFRDGAG